MKAKFGICLCRFLMECASSKDQNAFLVNLIWITFDSIPLAVSKLTVSCHHPPSFKAQEIRECIGAIKIL